MKPFWQSKTLWTNVALAALAFFPAVKSHVDENALAIIFAGVNMILRAVSKDKITLS